MRILGALFIAALALRPGLASAAYTLNISEAGSGVIAEGSGTIDTRGLRSASKRVADEPFIDAGNKTVLTGAAGLYDVYFARFSGLTPFGSGGSRAPDSSSGDLVGFDFRQGLIGVPTGYDCARFLTSTSVFERMSLTGLGLGVGTYTYVFGSGATRDTLTINVSALPVPEPASLAVLGAGLVAAGLVLRRRGGAGP